MDFYTVSFIYARSAVFVVGLHNLYSSPNIRVIKSREMSLAGHVLLWGRGEAHTGLWEGTPLGKRPLGILRYRWYDNIKVGL